MIICRKDFMKMIVFPCDLHVKQLWKGANTPYYAIIAPKIKIAEYSSTLKAQLVMRAILQAYKDNEKYYLLPTDQDAQALCNAFLTDEMGQETKK